MASVQGFVLAVPTENKAEFIRQAEFGWTMFRDFGCLEHHECWGVDVPEGTLTSFPMAVKKQEEETVVFSWLVWPDKATHDAGMAKMMQDPRMAEMGQMCFDGKRMIWGGFEEVVNLSQPAGGR
ncbi:MAG: DUF1428 domain-containing protein [Rhodobacterales bacterium]